MKFLVLSLAVVVASTGGPSAALALNGEEACEERGYDQGQCSNVGCCEWDDGQCWSAVGNGPCGGGGSGPLLPGLDGWVDGSVVWHAPPPGWTSCGRVTTVFGVAVCASVEAWDSCARDGAPTKCDHVAHVFHELLDNDEDGAVDDAALVARMVDGGYLLWVPADEDDAGRDVAWPPGVGVTQMTGIFEAVPNSCDVPARRGADPADRSTWPGAVSNTAGCTNERDATVEEILHLITTAAIELHPDIWGDSFQSQAGALVEAANGNCGWGFRGDYVDPSGGGCEGQYAYNDETCDEGCIVVEGIYWAIVSYVGGLYTSLAAADHRNEWLMITPDSGMELVPAGVGNARTLQDGSPGLYGLVSDTASEGHAWLPAVMPDGEYAGGGGGAPPPTPPPGPNPGPTPGPTPNVIPQPSPNPTPNPTSPSGQNGEEACEGHGYDQGQCGDVGCCEWDDGECWSAVGTDPCGPPGDCDQCDDVPSRGMDRRDRMCEDMRPGQLRRQCGKPNWTRNKFCQHSCFVHGFGYEGDDCCVE